MDKVAKIIIICMRRGNASWINETRKKAKCKNKCQFKMTLVYIVG